MPKYLDLRRPVTSPPDPLKPFIIAAVVVTLLLAVATFAFSADVPPEATLIQTVPLPCQGGLFLLYDTDRNVANGAEFIAIEADGRRVAILQFAPGDNGGFIAAVVQIPGYEEQVFTSTEALGAKWNHPCEIVRAAGART